MTGHAVFEGARRAKVFRASFDVAKLGIERREFGAKAEDGKIHGGATAVPAVEFRSLDHGARESFSLMSGSHGQHSEITSSSPNLHVDSSSKLPGAVIAEKEFAFAHHICQLIFVGPIPFKESFDGEGVIDYWKRRSNIGGCGEANRDCRFHGWEIR